MKIQIDGLTYSYPGSTVPVLEGFDLELSPGITLAKGFSGCGKSTLLRLIAGLLKARSGTITTSSRHRIGSPAYLREDVGIVFQSLNLLPLASLRRNIALGLHGVKDKQSRIDKWLHTFGLEPYADKRPNQLSGGQMQRASLARALAKEPKIVLLDEPTSGLDDLNTAVTLAALRENLADDVVCLIATHDPRLEEVATDVLDFNTFLPVEEHLQALV